MKKIFIYIFIIVIGAAAFYFGLTLLNKDKKETPKTDVKEPKKEEKVSIPTKEEFVNEAIKLQNTAERKGEDLTCKCYNVKELDSSSPLSGSILVYTVDDLFISTMWLSNGYYMLDGTENAAIGILDETSETASIYCGESSKDITPSLCAKNY